MVETSTVTALVAAAGEGDAGAWKALVERYAPLVGSVIVRHRLYGADAEDVAQTVWLRLVEHLRDLREPRALPMWLITISRNECVRVLKAGRRLRPVDPTTENDMYLGEVAEPDQALLDGERNQALLAAFAELSDRHRELLLLLTADPPFSYSEISRRLGVPVGSIGPTRARALRHLRECLEQANGERKGGPGGIATLR
ncbi:RNA polymerase sigma factor [Actinoplanes aureus]|jgi:RNA polymerase sigma factor (sigma-70 family)|uniref:Sigma-70 family RNA polymerase sigma factor n=1 Tax=Actinoplanes aureus TaxID=2792083 RepID=A0A931C738_9ACTN|nr:sigma-70 family RNA polymerase sigma factor [Actinoplanes aureus]MBG0564654.1 sigma-70 family RNA polymerase sigma factor [Actinoplanes aureus]